MDQIPTHYAQQYANTIMLLLQQFDSRLSGTVTPMSIRGAKAATICDQYGIVEATERTGRYTPLQPGNTPTDRPWVYPADFDWNDLVDSIDKLRVINDPDSALARLGMAAMNRVKDRVIIRNFFADRKTGETGGTTTTFPSGQVVAVNYGSASNVGLTVAKMREAKRILMAADLDVEVETLTIGVTAKQHDNLLAEMQVISLDFNEKPVLREGKVERFLGFNFKHTELLQTDTNSYRRIPAYAKSGMVLATWNDISTDISIRRDLAGLPVQVYVYGTFGATRTEDERVLEIKCAES
jgi:hypothetical protein